ncbi:hypothetical protein RLJV_23845 [Pseudomonas aeruginosa]|nr:hypothetical protein RLJV_23845 [Pseudomonas aeruginosa]
MRSRVCGSSTARIAPQSEWPQTMMWCTPSGAGDEHRPRPLAIGELLEQRLLLGKDLPAEMLESIDNPFQCIVSAFLDRSVTSGAQR